MKISQGTSGSVFKSLQSFTGSMNVAQTQKDITITAVDTDKSLVFLDRSTAILNDTGELPWAQLLNATTVRLTRVLSTNTCDYTAQVLEFQ